MQTHENSFPGLKPKKMRSETEEDVRINFNVPNYQQINEQNALQEKLATAKSMRANQKRDASLNQSGN